MISQLAHRSSLVPLIALGLLAGCVSAEKYDTLDQEYQQLQRSMSAEVGAQRMQITRLQNAVRVSVNSDLLFPSGGWQMSPEAKQIIATMAAILAPQKRADNVMQYMISQGVNPSLVAAHGFGDADPVASNETPQGRAQNRRALGKGSSRADHRPMAGRSDARVDRQRDLLARG